jgi:tyrosyl-tRNA synthetase
MDILAELGWRGLLADCTDREALARRLEKSATTLYAGFEPTADSLHVGHLVPLLLLRRFQLTGHRPIALAGGATGMIGDPSGKAVERKLLTRDEIAANVAGISLQLQKLLDFSAGPQAALLRNNADWFGSMGCLDFLREIGKHFTVNAMIAKESVRARMEDRETGISYTEFSYMLLQAYDFLHLLREEDCELQVGGSDQWGNITAGLDLCRKKEGRETYGLTVPLVTKSDGTKMGKTESGAVWLDSRRTSPYRFYQYWIQVEDADAARMLRFYTFLGQEEVLAYEAAVAERPESREAQRRLAQEVTQLIHGEATAAEAEKASQILFGGGLDGITESLFRDVAAEIPAATVRPDGAGGWALAEWVVQAGLCPSKGQARKDIQGGGIYINNEREADPAATVSPSHLLFGKYLLLRKGKRNYCVVTVENGPPC